MISWSAPRRKSLYGAVLGLANYSAGTKYFAFFSFTMTTE